MCEVCACAWCVYIYVCVVCVYGCDMCGYVCMFMVSVCILGGMFRCVCTGGGQRSTQSLPTWFGGTDLSLNLGRVAGWVKPGDPPVSAQRLVLGTWTQVPVFAQHALYPLSLLPSPLVLFCVDGKWSFMDHSSYISNHIWNAHCPGVFRIFPFLNVCTSTSRGWGYS